MRPRTILALSAIMFGTVYMPASAFSDDGSTQDDLRGKIVVLYLDGTMSTPSLVLMNAEYREVGGRMFLFGIGADTKRPKDWRTGKATRVAWQAVTGYMVFTPKEYEEYLKEAQETDDLDARLKSRGPSRHVVAGVTRSRPARVMNSPESGLGSVVLDFLSVNGGTPSDEDRYLQDQTYW